MAKQVKKSAAKVRASLGPIQLKALQQLSKKGEMTRSEISKALGGVFIGGNLMGHVDTAKTTPSSLVGRGYATVAVYAKGETDGPAYYKITAAGRKALENPPAPAKKAPAEKKAAKKAPVKKAPKKAAKKAPAKKAPAAAPKPLNAPAPELTVVSA